MNRILSFIATLAICTIANIAITVAQPPGFPQPCTPDCFTSPWGPLQVALIQAPAPYQNCWVTVYYVERTACTQQYRDIQILRIDVPFNGSCSNLITDLANQAFAGNVITRLHNIIGVELIKSKFTTWYNDPNTPQSEKDAATCGRQGDLGVQRWRVIRGSCWYNYHNPCNCKYEVRPCENTVCCLKQFYVCWDATTNKPKVTKEDNATPTSECPTPPSDATPLSVVAADGHCFLSCDDDGLDEVLNSSKPESGSSLSSIESPKKSDE